MVRTVGHSYHEARTNELAKVHNMLFNTVESRAILSSSAGRTTVVTTRSDLHHRLRALPPQVKPSHWRLMHLSPSPTCIRLCLAWLGWMQKLSFMVLRRRRLH